MSGSIRDQVAAGWAQIAAHESGASAAENVRRLSAECAARGERARVSAERFAEGVTLTDGRTHLMRRRRTLTHWPDHSHLYNGRTP